MRQLTLAWTLLFLVAPLLPHCQACWQHFRSGAPVAEFAIAGPTSAHADALAGAPISTMHNGCHQGVGQQPADPGGNQDPPDNCRCAHGAGHGGCQSALQGVAKVDSVSLPADVTRVPPVAWLASSGLDRTFAPVVPPPPVQRQWLVAGLPPELAVRVLLI